ncbi:hypothetical protein FBEOM_1516 [Fusarium beomiforme]|uniref:Uncharacterized protein n=1 Tax=Fusarium beomiforme TaxID=44412 RepID=A0A9P5E533_9HYPO|nr:hypothetical protein FBEOM_1516 [Fusarium beomiforme]
MSLHVPSPGNDYSRSDDDIPRMRRPYLELIYRIVAEMDKGGVTEIKGIDGTAKSRIVLPIQGGYVNGPQIKGVIVEKSGADWAEVINPNKILVKAQGIYRTGPGVEEQVGERDTVTQDEMEYFTHIKFEAPGDSSYGWLNGVVAIGVMTMSEGRPVIDCYRLTNFPGKRAANL